MTEANANGPAETQTTAPEANADTNQAPNGEGTVWTSGLQDADNRSYAETKGWKSPDDALKSQRELEKIIGKSVRLPDEKATDEEKSAFWRKMGTPEKADGYEFKLDTKSVPEDFAYDDKSAEWYRSSAYKNHLTKAQAEGLHNDFVSWQVDQQRAMREAGIEQVKQQETAAHKDLTADWGDVKSETYVQNVNLISKYMTDAMAEKPGLKPFFEASGVLSPDGAIRNADFAKLMLEHAKANIAPGSGGPAGRPAATPQDMADRMYGATTPTKRG